MSPEELLSLGFRKELVVIIIATLPIFELRGALPVAINVFNFPWHYALLLAVFGNLIPVPLVLLFFNAVYRLLDKISYCHKMLQWFVERTKKRGRIIERYERIGLVLFVAIPLPFTGAWTGSLAAVLFDLKFWQSFLSILIGILIAGVIVTCLSLMGWAGAVVAGVGLCSLAVIGLWKTSG